VVQVSELWPCPGCGTLVVLPEDERPAHGGLPRIDRDHVAHALCGCYVLTMGGSSLGRLLSAVLAVPARDGGPGAADGAANEDGGVDGA
jgi:hypothetical protein